MNIEKGLGPLTLIAIFAGIVEASALASLPFLSESSQTIYTWFLVGFPFFLTVLFFLTLNFNHRSLYQPPPQEAADKHFDSYTMNTPPPQPHQPSPINKTIALSGPEAQKFIEAHILRTLTHRYPQARSWTLCNLDTRMRIRLSVSPVADDEELSDF
ncbi:hypothetical protein [Pseudomonas sp. xss_2]|uniref:hypothetical protein n=1 Tax=Pseudomonas sp. xss_2 TaxID=3367215 RepID=UPI00370C861C